MASLVLAACSTAVTLLCAADASARVLVTIEVALAQVFADASVERESLFLTDDQLAAVEKQSGVEGQKPLVTRHVARRGETIVGYAYVDTHRVRTLPETVLIVIDIEGAVQHIEVVSFREPLEYLPPGPWYEQFTNHDLTDELTLKRIIRPITGATLTARATTDAVRRMLAVHKLVTPQGATQ